MRAALVLVVVLQSGLAAAMEAQLAQRVRTLDCAHVTPADVHDTLAPGPTPRMILIDGSVPIVTMASFARFLVAMGYPEESIRNPRDGELSYSSYQSSDRLAGMIAWYYERDGTMPILVGHSQGGMLVVRTLHELAGRFASSLPVVDPETGQAQARDTIRDPLTGVPRGVVGLRIGYAAALATGKLARFLLGQWSMLPLLRRIPDSVEEFAGFRIPGDPIAGDLFGEDPYAATGTAIVHNITLPSEYHHVTLPRTEQLAQDPATRAFIERYDGEERIPVDLAQVPNLVQGAILWHDIRTHWCMQAQALAAHSMP